MLDAEVKSLGRVVYVRNPNGDDGDDSLITVGMSEGLTPDDADLWRGLVTLDPLDAPTEQESQAAGLFKGPDGNFILAHTRHPEGDPAQTICQYILLSRPLLVEMAADLVSLMDLATNTLPETAEEAALEPLDVAGLPEPLPEDPATFFDKLLADYNYADMTVFFVLLDAALDESLLLLRGFMPHLDARVALIQALMFLLPPPARPELTFATHVAGSDPSPARVVFGEQANGTSRRAIDLSADDLGAVPLQSPYVQHLENLWQGDVAAFVKALNIMISSVEVPWEETGLHDGLAAIADRYQLDLDVLSDVEVSIEHIRAVLRDAPPRAGDLRTAYVLRLMAHALKERNTDSAALAARFMAENGGLRGAVTDRLMQVLDAEPDAVYFFVRTQLAQGVDPTWIPLLQQAAATSLQVAIESGDQDILWEWLELIAREPDDYQLDEVLRNSISEIQQRARSDGGLGKRLLLFICKRAPALVEVLLRDSRLMGSLVAPVGPALRAYDPEAVVETIGLGREIALVLMGCAVQEAAANAPAAAVFTPSSTGHLWGWLCANSTPHDLPGRFTPAHILNELATGGVAWLDPEALQTLLNNIVAAENADLLRRISAPLASEDRLFPMLVIAFQNSDLPAENVLDLVAQISAADLLTSQQVINLYLRLADHHNWHSDAVQPLVEQIARFIQQDQTLTVPVDVLWQMLQIAIDGEIDIVVRVVSRRILASLETLDDDARLVEMFLRLYEQLRQDNTTRTLLLNRWRGFVQRQAPTRLHHLSDLLAERRARDEVRAIVQTGIAIKWAIGSQTLEGFAVAINTTYTTLQALSDAFDPVDQPAGVFDQPTVRAELEAREAELTPDEQRVLAKNLKELAQIISLMADRRSKASLMRREEDIERQLTSGEQAPHSAIDTLKWLSGYLNGIQARNGTED